MPTKPRTTPAPKVVKDRTPLAVLVNDNSVDLLDDYEPAPEQVRENPVYNTIKAMIDAGKAAARVKVPLSERGRIVSAWQTQANKLDKTARPYDEANEGDNAVIVFRLVDKIVRERKPK